MQSRDAQKWERMFISHTWTSHPWVSQGGCMKRTHLKWTANQFGKPSPLGEKCLIIITTILFALSVSLSRTTNSMLRTGSGPSWESLMFWQGGCGLSASLCLRLFSCFKQRSLPSTSSGLCSAERVKSNNTGSVSLLPHELGAQKFISSGITCVPKAWLFHGLLLWDLDAACGRCFCAVIGSLSLMSPYSDGAMERSTVFHDWQ